jgi:hypothetical protein
VKYSTKTKTVTVVQFLREESCEKKRQKGFIQQKKKSSRHFSPFYMRSSDTTVCSGRRSCPTKRRLHRITKQQILETNLQTFDCQGEKHQAQKRRRRVAHLPAMELEMPLAAKAHGSGGAKKICDKQSQQQQQYRQPQQQQWQQIRTQTQQNNSLPLRPPPPSPQKIFFGSFFFLLKISLCCTYDIYLFY